MTRTLEELSRDEHMDLKLLVECIKTDLFPKAKFVLGKDEWDVGGRTHKDCIKCCDGRIGFKTMTDVERERCMEKIWMTAMSKKLQKKALVQKRSATHTAMQNKFAGNRVCRLCSPRVSWLCDLNFQKADLCQVCVDTKCVMLSLESMERRLEDPKARCVFCQCFHKAAVGEVRWKECMDSTS